MPAEWTPMQWPSSWKDPAALDLLKGTAFNCLLMEKGAGLDPVRARAQQSGIQVVDPTAVPSGVVLVKGEWPGVKMTRGGGGGGGGTGAGPTGVPWVNSNGWSVSLAQALHPGSAIWASGEPDDTFRVAAGAYVIAIADSAAYGGRWIVSLDKQTAAGIASKNAEALGTWKKIVAASGFFAARKAWQSFAPMVTLAVVSDFTGDNEYFGGELLNLLSRAGQHSRIVPKGNFTPASFQGVRAVIYGDDQPPAENLRKQVISFVQGGGLLVTSAKWGEFGGQPSKEDHPRFTLFTLGKGRVAIAKPDESDPYLWANDAGVLISHRYDLVRFWNGGATGSFYAMSPDRKQAVVHLFFYSNRGPDSASVRVAGKYRSAKLSMVDQPAVPKLTMETQKDAVEVHLPQVSQYVALELDV